MGSQRRQLAALGANDITCNLTAADGKVSAFRNIQCTDFAAGRIQRERAGLDRHLFVYIDKQLQRAALVCVGLRRRKSLCKSHISGRFAVFNDSRRKVAVALCALVILVISGVFAHCHGNCKSIGIEYIAVVFQLNTVLSRIRRSELPQVNGILENPRRLDRVCIHDRSVCLFTRNGDVALGRITAAVFNRKSSPLFVVRRSEIVDLVARLTMEDQRRRHDGNISDHLAAVMIDFYISFVCIVIAAGGIH